MEAWGYRHLQEHEAASELAIDDLHLRAFVLREGRLPRRNVKESESSENTTAAEAAEPDKQLGTGHRRLVEQLLDTRFYDPTVHPRRNFRLSTRVNLSMSLYQILEVDERRQSIVVNVWMVQDWFDEFLDWKPPEYAMINKTIVPYQQIWVPDTVLYNSEQMDRRGTEALMNAIVETGYWRGDDQGAAVQLMFPAIYKLSCRMDVRFFPYDQQNCTFIISSWTHDMATMDYHFARPSVNMLNFAQNDEWTVISFDFERVEQSFKCCPHPWAMLYAHLVIRRKPLYYIVNLVIPTSIITVVAVTGFFTPTSSSSERDEKLYLGINTLMTMMLMLLMVTNQMPNTSNYVPLMSWYYMGIIGTVVCGTLMATFVLFLHSRKSQMRPVPRPLLSNFMLRPWLWALVLEPPVSLKELWAEYGLLLASQGEEAKEAEATPSLGQLLQQGLPRPGSAGEKNLRKERQLAAEVRRVAQAASRAVGRERRRRETIVEAADFLSKGVFGHRKAELHQLQRQLRALSQASLGGGGGGPNSRLVRRQKMMRRCGLEWEYLANCVDRCLLTLFACLTIFFFCLLAFFERWAELHRHFTR